MRIHPDRREFLKGVSSVAGSSMAAPGVLSLVAVREAFAQSRQPAVAAESAGAEFPSRPLMQPVVENSLEHRLLAKPVQDSVLLDDMETDRGRQSELGDDECD